MALGDFGLLYDQPPTATIFGDYATNWIEN
jgi:hypothetical protein